MIDLEKLDRNLKYLTVDSVILLNSLNKNMGNFKNLIEYKGTVEITLTIKEEVNLFWYGIIDRIKREINLFLPVRDTMDVKLDLLYSGRVRLYLCLKG